MRIATWNVNSLKARIEKLDEWLAYAKPDVLCMQETKLADAAFPGLEIERMGYEWAHHGSGRWNGVAILSRVGLTDVHVGFGDGLDDEATETRAITATCGGVKVTSVYVPNGRTLEDDHYQFKLRWLGRLRDFLDRTATPGEKVAVLGDFNIAPEDKDVYSPRAFIGSTHVSEPERKALTALTEWGLVDTFRQQWPQERLFTYFDYRAGMFHKGNGMRIDLILASRPLADLLTYTVMDRNARKGQSPSDHAPLLADFSL